MRCEVTGNPCGTDTRPEGKPCQCAACKSSASPACSIADLVPTNWLDPLLTGPDSVLPPGYNYVAQDIERLLRAIKARIQAAEAQRQRADDAAV